MKSKRFQFFTLIVLIGTLVSGQSLSSPSLTTNECAVDGSGQLPHLRFESDSFSRFLSYEGFVVRYDIKRRQPAFTIHVLRPEAINLRGRVPARRRSGFRVETLLGGTITASDRDYSRSGYDRGHLVPAGDFSWDQHGKNETFTYTNVAPFNPNLNRGAWAQLEAAIRDRVSELDQEAYVVTGSLFMWTSDSIGPDSLKVPTHYYKLALYPAAGEAFAFLFDNSITTYTGDLHDFQTTIDFVESMTGEDFYDRLEDDCEEIMESTRSRFRTTSRSR